MIEVNHLDSPMVVTVTLAKRVRLRAVLALWCIKAGLWLAAWIWPGPFKVNFKEAEDDAPTNA